MDSVEYILRIILKARDEMAAVLARVRTEIRGLGTDADKTRVKIEGLNKVISSMNTRVTNATKKVADWRAALKGAGDDADGFGDGLRRVGDESQRISSALRGQEDAHRRNAKAADTDRNALSRLTRELGLAGDNIASLDNRIRGIALLLLFSFAQQVITALTALGGELVSVAGSASMAGAALGGTFVAGMMQAIPAIGLFIGALSRVKAVIEAVGQAQKVQQAQSVQGARDQATAGAQADKLADAQDAVADAHRRVADANDAVSQASARLQLAQENLNDARRDGRRELEDLIYMEKQAQLAAQGAALSQEEAQKALQRAISTGQTDEVRRRQLEVREATLQANRAKTDSGRATQDRSRVGGDVNNLDSVQQAAKQVEDAQRGIEQAVANVDDANRAVSRANRNLSRARAEATNAAGSVVTAQATLDYMIAQMSPAEQKLYKAASSLYETYRRIFGGEGTGESGIYGVIVGSFTRATKRVEKIIEMPGVIKTLDTLANSISTNFNRVFDAFTGGGQLAQFQRIIEQSAENLGPLTTILIRVGKAVLNIAEAANPALEKMLAFVGDIAAKFLGITDDRPALEDFFLSGEEHLESWVNLALAFINLFAALVGASAGEGKRSVEDLTKTLNGAADSIRDNGERATKFFSDARKVVYDIGRVVVALGKEIFRSFDPGAAKNFADIMIETVIPAIGLVIRGVGRATDFIADLLSNPVAREIAKWGIAFLVLAQVSASTIGALTYFGQIFKHLYGLIRVGVIAFTGLSAEAATFGTVMSTLGRVALVAAPWVAVAAGIVFLLDKLGLLDDAFQAFLGFFRGIWEQLRPPLERLMDAFKGMFAAINEGKGAFGPIMSVLRFFLGILIKIAGYLLHEFGKAIGQVFGGLIDVIAGVINVVVGLLSGDWKKAWDGAKGILLGVINAILGILKLVFLKGAGTLLGLLPRLFAGIARTAAFRFIELMEKIGPALLRFFRGLPGRLVAIFLGALGFFLSLGDKIANAIEKGVRAIFGFFRSLPKRLAGFAIDAAALFVKGFAGVGGKILEAIFTGVKGAAGFAKNIVNGIIKLVEDAINSVDKIGPISVPDIHLPRLQQGGPVPGGYGGGDRVGILAEPGEFVVRKERVRKFGLAFFEWLNGGAGSAGPGFATGGQVGGGAGGSLTINFNGGGLDDFQSAWRRFWNDLRNVARQGANYIENQFDDMRSNTGEDMERMSRRTRSLLGDIADTFFRRGNAIERNWLGTFAKLSDATYGGLFYIGHETNRALTALGEKHIDFHLSKPKAERRAVGGPVGGSWGQRGMDTVLTWLGKGEAVLNHWQQAAVNALLPGGTTLRDVVENVRGTHAGPLGQLGFATGRAPYAFAPIPGMPGEEANTRIIPLLMRLIRQYRALVTDAYDRDHSAGHKSPGHNVTGTAVDLVPGRGGSWNLIEALGRWAVGKGLVVGYGAGVPGSQAWPMHGRGHHIHIEFGGNPALAAASLDQVGRPRIRGGGAFAGLAQAAIDKVRGAANSKLGDVFDPVSGATTFKGGVLSQGEVGGYIRKALDFLNISQNVGEWVRTLTRQAWRESSFNPNAVNNWDINAQRGDPSKGLVQITGSNFSRYKGRGHGNILNPLDNLIAVIKYVIATYGSGDAGRAVETLWARGGGAFARGGIVPGGEGEPRSIIAHAGEWILNKFQQMRLASLIGLAPDTLRSLLGFHGKGGDAGYQGGTEIIGTVGKPTASLGGTATGTLTEFDRLLAEMIEAVRNIASNMKRSTNPKLKRLGRGKLLETAIKQFENLVSQDGPFDKLASSIQTQVERAATRLQRATYKIVSGTVMRRLGDTDVAERGLNQLVDTYDDLLGERGQIQKALASVKARLKKGGLSTDRRERLEALQVNLAGRLDDVNAGIASNIEARYQQQIALQQSFVDEINAKATAQTATNDIFKRMASALGNNEWLAQINAKQRDILAEQANALEGRIAAASGAGATELANQLGQQVADIRTQIFESIQQELQDSIAAINDRAQRRTGRLDLFNRMADALGVVGSAARASLGGESFSRSDIFRERGAALEAQRSGLQGALRQAGVQGNVGLIQQLTDALVELDVTIQENTKAAFNAKVEDLNNRTGFASDVNDLNKQILELTGQISGQIDSAGMLANAQERMAILQGRANELQALYNEAVASGDIQAQQDLRKALLENQVATLQNTQALNELTGATADPQTFTSTAWEWFRNAIFNGMGGVLPQYQVGAAAAGMASANAVGQTGFQGFTAGSSTSTTTSNGLTANVTINEAGRPIDPTEVVGAVGFAMKTAE